MESVKLAISTNGPTLDDTVNPRFGRAPGFLIVDSQSLEFSYLDNGLSQTMSQGAGIQAAQNVAGSGAQVVLTGYVGPKAFTALEAAHVQVGQDVENMTVRKAVEEFNNGKITLAASPNAEGKSGMDGGATQAPQQTQNAGNCNGAGRGQGGGGRGQGRGMGRGQGGGQGGGRCGGQRGGGRF
ncbi:NifB/NifX family molybdenum-iron cluster-binding protein [Halodesulfovibrio sp.]|jgi:predicted Fe-Mo cluster-binding NifX family protein|uniref:NifB/NifX family molybdenum-iron cluster-binding protein n=1 Tax=Halodesulfovibrio sp. TaxID=1912772 RepID=UPI0025F8C3BC|nr:NifB/NifX family molybdenum-iron cluster-binding protein [Halodesulfovibrio sp.]MCT4536317.1 NifB/NifX family molybdenum-iron cluster-binding protein [Halodesulfovibrio sp.]